MINALNVSCNVWCNTQHISMAIMHCLIFTLMEICVTDTGNTVIHLPITEVHTIAIDRYIYRYMLIIKYHHLYVYPLRYMMNCNSHRAKRVFSMYTQELSTIPPTQPSYQHLYCVYIYYRTCCAAVPTDRLSLTLTFHGYQ